MSLTLLAAAIALAEPVAVFESGPVRPIAVDAAGDVWVCNLPDGRLERLDGATGAVRDSIPVGLDPVAVALHGERAWVVDHQSDAVSVVQLGPSPSVISVLQVADEPRDIVFAGDRAFVTASRRGVEGLPYDPDPLSPSTGRADVWVFDAQSDPPVFEQVVQLFGDSPRALAVSADEQTVYAAVFRSGNQTAIVPQHIVCDGGESALPCTLDGYQLPGGLPGPNDDADGLPQPETGLLVRHDGAAWIDELGRDWSDGIRFELPDYDVFALDATAAAVVQTEEFRGVGTVLFAMAPAPDSDELWVAATEARNEIRFSGFGGFGGPTVRGRLHESRLTRIGAGTVEPVHLNPHIDYATVPSPPGVAEASLAQPVALAIDPEGQVWVAGYGSSALAVHSLDALRSGAVEATADRLVPTLGGPSGLGIDPAARVIFVYARFDNAVQAFDLDSRELLWTTHLHTPEPAEVVAGRAAFFDARSGSSNGEQSCGSCHVFGQDDGLAWDLGDPDGRTATNPNPVITGDPASQAFDFHPLKGPMQTQTLRGIADSGALHWRGDRTGGLLPGAGAADPGTAFLEFAGATETVMGAASPATPGQIEAMADWAMALEVAPNPWLPRDGVRTPAQQDAWDLFSTGDCIECHLFDPASGHWGTDGSVAANSNATQFMKVPSLRQTYLKLGLYWTGNEPRVPGPGDPLGPQIRAFGFFHDGAAGSLADEVLPAVLAFPGSHAPAVGDEGLLSASGAGRAQLDVLVERSLAGDCDLVAHIGAAGLLFDGDWLPDDEGTPWSTDALELAGPVRYLCAPVGTGRRLALDRDQDGWVNGLDNCPAVANPDQLDGDRDGHGDLCQPDKPTDTGLDGPEPFDPELRSTVSIHRPCGCSPGGSPGWVWLLAPLVLVGRRARH